LLKNNHKLVKKEVSAWNRSVPTEHQRTLMVLGTSQKWEYRPAREE